MKKLFLALAVAGSLLAGACENPAKPSPSGGSAIYAQGNLSIKGCTFYNNSASSTGGAVYVNAGTTTLTGNMFSYNSSSSSPYCVYQRPALYEGASSGTIISGGYNVVIDGGDFSDVGFTKTETDTTCFLQEMTNQFDIDTFIAPGFHSYIPSAPPDFPLVDFNGDTRTFPGAPGAIGRFW